MRRKTSPTRAHTSICPICETTNMKTRVLNGYNLQLLPVPPIRYRGFSCRITTRQELTHPIHHKLTLPFRKSKYFQNFKMSSHGLLFDPGLITIPSIHLLMIFLFYFFIIAFSDSCFDLRRCTFIAGI